MAIMQQINFIRYFIQIKNIITLSSSKKFCLLLYVQEGERSYIIVSFSVSKRMHSLIY